MFEAIGKHPGQQVVFGLGGVPSHAQFEREVDATIRIRQFDLEDMQGGTEGHQSRRFSMT